MNETRQNVHDLIDQLLPAQLSAVEDLLKALLGEDLTEEDRHAVQASREHFRQGGEGVPFEQLAAECGFTMDEIHSYKGE